MRNGPKKGRLVPITRVPGTAAVQSTEGRPSAVQDTT